MSEANGTVVNGIHFKYSGDAISSEGQGEAPASGDSRGGADRAILETTGGATDPAWGDAFQQLIANPSSFFRQKQMMLATAD